MTSLRHQFPATHANLATRLEQAGPESQADLLEEAWMLLNPFPDYQGPCNGECPYCVREAAEQRFIDMLDCGAYLSAAEMLVPEDMRDEIEITTLYLVARVTINMNHGPDDGPFYGNNACNSIPLALAAASLRASIVGNRHAG